MLPCRHFPRLKFRFFSILLLALGWGTNLPIHSAPHKPDRPDVVLERLPVRLDRAEEDRISGLRLRLKANPEDAPAAAELAESHYRIAQRQGDPRHIGYAQAILSRWRDSPAPPVDIRLVRALLSQYVHDFPSARKDLDAVLADEPGNLAALSYRAVLHLVSANYRAARQDCEALARHGKGLVVESCGPTVDALTGQAAKAYTALAKSLSNHRSAPPNERLWTLTRLAEIAVRLDRSALAESHFRDALAIGITDQYLLAAFAEFLIDAGRHADAIELLREHTANDVLLLRLAIAEQAAGHPEARARASQVATRFDANRRRGDTTHLADEAWFELRFLGNAQRALALAKENWAAEQREPGDAMILLESALATGRPTEADPVLQWLDESMIEDARLRRLAARLRETAAPKGTTR